MAEERPTSGDFLEIQHVNLPFPKEVLEERDDPIGSGVITFGDDVTDGFPHLNPAQFTITNTTAPDEGVITVNTNDRKSMVLTMDDEIILFNEEGEVGTLSWKEGKVSFRGNVTESAVSLLESLAIIVNAAAILETRRKSGIIREEPNGTEMEKNSSPNAGSDGTGDSSSPGQDSPD